MKALYVKKFYSSKSDSTYLALCVDLEYAEKKISFDNALMSELTELPVSQLMALKVGETYYIYKAE